MRNYDVIGGKSDGAKVTTTKRDLDVCIELRGQKYIAIQFNDGGREVTLYMLANTKPVEAIQAWKERNEIKR